MPKADHIKKLVASFGRNQEFEQLPFASSMMQLIRESGPSSSRLGKILDANVRPD